MRMKVKNAIKTLFSDKYLLYTNMGISITLSGAGDILQQCYEICVGNQRKELNGLRTRNMCASGMTVGALCHYWYKFLDRRLPGYTIRTVMKKILVDQAICSPLCITSLFLTVGYLEGATGRQLFEEARQKAAKLYLAEWVVWPPAQFVNFYLLPTKYRVLYDNTVSLGYDIYTSAVKNSELEDSGER